MDMTILDIALRLTATSPQAVDNCAVAFPISLIFHTVKNSGRETEWNPLSGFGNQGVTRVTGPDPMKVHV